MGSGRTQGSRGYAGHETHNPPVAHAEAGHFPDSLKIPLQSRNKSYRLKAAIPARRLCGEGSPSAAMRALCICMTLCIFVVQATKCDS
jgi:hypothetical protein